MLLIAGIFVLVRKKLLCNDLMKLPVTLFMDYQILFIYIFILCADPVDYARFLQWIF